MASLNQYHSAIRNTPKPPTDPRLQQALAYLRARGLGQPVRRLSEPYTK